MSDPQPESAPLWLEVGRIGRAHGLNGDVVVTLSTDRTERVRVGTRLRAGKRQVLVTSSRPHQGRWIVHFDGVAGREDAELLRGLVLSAEAIDDPDTLWVHSVIGREVFDIDGLAHGRVESVLDNPAHDLLVLEGGAMVPVVFVVDDTDSTRLIIDPPAGLFDQ